MESTNKNYMLKLMSNGRSTEGVKLLHRKWFGLKLKMTNKNAVRGRKQRLQQYWGFISLTNNCEHGKQAKN